MEIKNLFKSSNKIQRSKFFVWLGGGFFGMLSLQNLLAEAFIKKTKITEEQKIKVKLNPNAVSRKNKV